MQLFSPKKFMEGQIDRARGIFEKHRDTFIKIAVMAAFLLFVALLIAPSNKAPLGNYREGEVASETVRAQENMEIIDEAKTENARKEAAQGVISIYDYDDSLVKTATINIKAAFENMRAVYAQDFALPENQQKEDTGSLSPEITKNWLSLYKPFKEIASFDITEQEFLGLASSHFSRAAEKRILRLIGIFEKRYIVNDISSLREDRNKGIVIRNISSTSPLPESYLKDFSGVIDMSEASKLLQDRAQLFLAGLKPSLKNAIISLVEKFIKPNIFINMQLTSAKMEEAKLNIKPLSVSIQKNEVIVREGDRIEKRQKVILDGIKKARREINTFEIKMGISIVMVLLTFITFVFAKSYIRKFSPSTKDLVFLFITTVLTVLLAKLLLNILGSIGDKFPAIPPSTYRLLIPVAASAMLIRFAINSETAIIFAFIISLIMGFVFDGDMNYAIYCFIGSVTGAYKIAYSETKFNLIKAGLLTGVVNAIAALSLEMIGGKAFTAGYSDLLAILGMSLSSGIFIALMLPTLSTLAEASGYLTDIKLMELANFNNPLLNKLALIAPGTYHHSRVVAQLVEVAAESIHANPLLAMVSAFYHDIGKINQPEYFIENQGTGSNKHDELKPSMSKMIIVTHVKDGVDMTKEAKVPKQIIDAIEQHHGTSLISFFYTKAKSQENPSVEIIDESDYRYPGPKPQTREIGLLMLADAVEAASKSIVDPTPAQLQGVIQKVFNKIFSDGQLEDCEITLKDLHKIAASFFRVLISIYKSRVIYPESTPKEGQKKRHDGDTHSKSAKEDKAKGSGDKEDNQENLKRIGIEKP